MNILLPAHQLGAARALALLCCSGAASVAEAIYSLDPAHTEVDFSWSQMGLSEPGASFDDITGTLHWDTAEPTRSSVDVTMPLSGARNRVPGFDDALRSA